MQKFVISAVRRTRLLRWAGALVAGALFISGAAVAQTTFGSAKTIVFPVVASTPTFVGQITLYNPNGSGITVNLSYFDALNTATPGTKPCADVAIPANSSVQFGLAGQCTLGAGSHFGLLIAADSANANQFYGYSRTQNNVGEGFSIEGFPVNNFSTTVSNATGLIRQAAAQTYQTNCFVGSLADPVTYNLKLFNGATGAQIGTTLSGSLNAFEQFRYLDVFAAAAAPAGDFSNVRAEFTPTSAGTAVLIGFCTVQDNASFGADFRIAKSTTPALPTGTVPWGGAIQDVIGSTGTSYVFAGPTATAHLSVASTLSAFGSASLGRSGGPSVTVSIGVCYQDQAGPGPVSVLGTATTVDISSTQTSYAASGSAALPAATYNVGFCIQNNSGGSVNKNGATSGFAVITP